MGASIPSVLVVEDDPETRELYESMLDDHEVESVATGAAALEVTMARPVDIVLLDRGLPGLRGDTVAAELRRRSEPPMVAIVTGVEPDLDILQLACDAYVTKPVTGRELRATVARLARRADYDDRLSEYAAMAAKRATLDAAVAREVLQESQEYRALCRHLDTLRQDLDGMVLRFDSEDFTTAFRHPDFEVSPPLEESVN